MQLKQYSFATASVIELWINTVTADIIHISSSLTGTMVVTSIYGT